jgi:hypothetical protein
MSAAPMRSAAAAKSSMDGTMTCPRKHFILREASKKSEPLGDGPEVQTAIPVRLTFGPPLTFPKDVV